MRLNSLTVQGFRGVRCPLTLELDPRGLVIQGGTGHGKSSLVDALEWAVWGRVPHLLNFEFASQDDVGFCLCDPPEPVEVSLRFLQDGQFQELRRSMIPGKAPALIESPPPALAAVSPSNVILRRATLSDFVVKTKGEKLKALEDLFGLDELGDAHSQILAAANALLREPEFVQADNRCSDAETRIKQILGEPAVNEANVIRKAAELAKALDLPLSIDTPQDLVSVREEVGKCVSTSPEIARILRIQEALTTANDNLPISKDLTADIQEHRHMLSQQALRQARAYSRIRRLVLDLRRDETWTDEICPVCGQRVTDLAALVERLEREIADTETRSQEWDKLLARTTVHRDRAERLQDALWKLASGDLVVHQVVDKRKDELLLAAGSAQALRDALRKVVDHPERQLPDFAELDWVGSLARELTDAVQEAKSAADRVAPSPEQQERQRKAQELQSIAEAWTTYAANAAVAALYQSQKRTLDEVLRLLHEHEDNVLSDRLQELSSRVNEFFQILHPDEGVVHLRIETTTDEAGRGAEFSATFHGKDLVAPRRVLSEGHFHSLGLCLFLAHAERVLAQLRFLVLDDVVTSLDADHRRRVADLLRCAFADWQVIVVTHDPDWADCLRSKCHLRVRLLGPWSPNIGVVCSYDSLPHLERAQQYLASGDAVGAGPFVRLYLEREMMILAEGLQARLPFLMGLQNEKRTLMPLVDAVKAALKPLDKQHNALTTYRAFQEDAGLANLLAHYAGTRPAPPAVGELSDLLAKFSAFLSALACDECSQRPHFRHSPAGLGPPECKCHAIRLS